MKKIIRNRIKCKKCGEIIESTSRVGSKDDYEELIEYEGSDDDEE